jgi:hypothetical protein
MKVFELPEADLNKFLNDEGIDPSALTKRIQNLTKVYRNRIAMKAAAQQMASSNAETARTNRDKPTILAALRSLIESMGPAAPAFANRNLDEMTVKDLESFEEDLKVLAQNL